MYRFGFLCALVLVGALSACSTRAQFEDFAKETAIILDGAAPASTLSQVDVPRWTARAAKLRAHAREVGGPLPTEVK